MDVESSPAGASVDEVHTCVDGLVLSIFEAVLGHEAVTAETSAEGREIVTAAKCRAISEKYAAAQSAVDRLVGIDRTPQQQEEEILRLSEQCKATRERILQREAQLVQRRNDIDSQIKDLINDSVLGLHD